MKFGLLKRKSKILNKKSKKKEPELNKIDKN